MWIDAFKEIGVQGGTIGAELSEESNMGAPILDWEALKAGMPEARFIDALDIIYTLRAVKSPKEVEYMREAGRLAGVGCAAAWDVLANAARTGTRRGHVRRDGGIAARRGSACARRAP